MRWRVGAREDLSPAPAVSYLIRSGLVRCDICRQAQCTHSRGRRSYREIRQTHESLGCGFAALSISWF